MDNCCCYTSTNDCLNLFRKAVLFDSSAFLIKIGVAIYFLIVGIEYKIKGDHNLHRHPDYLSSSTVALYIFGGSILIILVLLRLILNRILYNDSKHPENVMLQRPRCCNVSWLIVSIGSLTFSCVVVAIPNIPLIIRLTGWVSIVLEPLMFLAVIMFRRVVRQRFNIDDTESNYN